jgi:hypothetical protein
MPVDGTFIHSHYWMAMTIFAVFRVGRPEALQAAIEGAFPDDHIQLQNDEWLISADMTPEELSRRIGIKEGENGSAIIFSMRGYYGRAPSDVWDWIKTKAEASLG